MHIELTEAVGSLDAEGQKLYVNPAHVALIERGVNASAPEKQAFISEITVVGVGKRRVHGSPSEVRKALQGSTPGSR